MSPSSSKQFEAWWQDYELTGKLGVIRLGMTRDDLHQLFGEPDDTAKGFRKQPQTGIRKYGDVEFHFGLEGELWLIMLDECDETPQPRIIAQKT